jgi:hypothetical protein
MLENILDLQCNVSLICLIVFSSRFFWLHIMLLTLLAMYNCLLPLIKGLLFNVPNF